MITDNKPQVASGQRHRSVAAGEFKAKCLALMDEVATLKSEILITKHRKPIAKLVPVDQPPIRPFIGRSPGFFQTTGDLIAPIGPDWEVDADL